MSVTIHSEPIPNIPWQPKPAGCPDIVWRYDKNPIIDRRPMPGVAGIYNSAVVPFQGKFVGVFRTEYNDRIPHLHFGRSDDGLKWQFDPKEIEFQCEDPEVKRQEYGYDPRLTRIDDTYYITWCNGYHGPTIGLARTHDFQSFEQLENSFLPYNRNGVLFPRKINGNYAMLSRPSDTGHTPFGDIFFSESPDLTYWGKHRHVMAKGRAGQGWWQDKKIGAGPSPIETSEGWLLFYHGVIESCNGFIYSTGAALLDLDQPWKVLYRTNQAILMPEAPYEVTGFVPNVVFPVTALVDAPTGRIALYCGAADTFTTLAFCQADEVIAFTKENSQV
jgi:beta-1,4-mannooligosaccharide/beta-1,4-mannosyl-N-acetylglucosamine phosphorylase